MRFSRRPAVLQLTHGTTVVVVSSSNSNELSLVKANQKQRNGRRDMTIALLDFQADQDNDGDGVPNIADAFPDNIGEWRDTDGDGVGNVQDNDDDGDGVNDDVDAFPLRSADSADNDNDGIANSLDLFDDNALENFDFDQDGIGDYSDDDMDGDNVLNDNDAAPLDPTESLDTDGDGIGDSADPDRDGDGIPNVYDPAPDNGFDPVITFTGFDPFDTNTNKAPLPDGFGFPSDWTIEIDELSFETTLASKPIDSGVATVDLTKTLSRDSKLHFFYRYDGYSWFRRLYPAHHWSSECEYFSTGSIYAGDLYSAKSTCQRAAMFLGGSSAKAAMVPASTAQPLITFCLPLSAMMISTRMGFQTLLTRTQMVTV